MSHANVRLREDAGNNNQSFDWQIEINNLQSVSWIPHQIAPEDYQQKNLALELMQAPLHLFTNVAEIQVTRE